MANTERTEEFQRLILKSTRESDFAQSRMEGGLR
jgi:hypothetical protein